ncbi:MAG: NAD(P)-dependent oxidoreductase [Bifidobacteriaceae bacterium]|jgi:nucleoside-diphosphate-sugar epimerase|nr:NAD(P)-dependent oxidoreductase [Bifidobacteriaceae bacterium]
MTKALVTGGSGGLAACVIPRLGEAGYEVTAFDVTPPHQPGEMTPWGAAPPPLDKSVPFVLGDLTSLEDCFRALAFSEAEVLVHLGAIPGPSELRRGGFAAHQSGPEDATMRSNVMGTYYLMEAARRIGLVKKVVFASTYYVLGLMQINGIPFKVEYLPIDEEHPMKPQDSYGLSKIMGEQILEAYAEAYGIQAVAFRLMGIDKPYREKHLYQEKVDPKPGHVGGPVITTYQYVDARDVADATVLALEAEGLDPFEAFYLVTDSIYEEDTKSVVARAWPDLVPLAKDLVGTDGIISAAKAKRKLGFEPHYSWRGQK